MDKRDETDVIHRVACIKMRFGCDKCFVVDRGREGKLPKENDGALKEEQELTRLKQNPQSSPS